MEKRNDTTKDHPNLKNSITFGQRSADGISKWAGSWTFILIFGTVLLFWIIVNSTWIIFGKTWDRFPFILLNLFLSFVAAFQAPIILMSQNRAAEKDRQRAEYDYAVNRKTEREMRLVKKQLTKIENYLHKK